MHVALLVTQHCQASSVFVALDLLIAANHANKTYLKNKHQAFTFELIGSSERVLAYNGASIGELTPVEKSRRPDLLIVPGAFAATTDGKQIEKYLSQKESLKRIFSKWKKSGTVFAAACTGNFFLAATGISKGQTMTCHWASIEAAKQLFPKEDFAINKILIDHGTVISAGGASAVSQLVLYLVRRFYSHELASLTGKLMLIEPNLEEQSRYAIFDPRKTHGDRLILALQEHIEKNFSLTADFAAYAQKNNLGERQLTRRFKKCTGETPLSYQQKFRVEKVKTWLETSAEPINQLIYNVGYEDASSFRRLFKRTTGLTMHEYRSRFASP